MPSGIAISQNIRAAPGASVRHGRIEKVAESGFANISASVIRAKPSIAEPSNPIPSAKAFSNSGGAIATDFKKPSTSVNQSRTNLIFRSSRVLITNSSCFWSWLSAGDMAAILPKSRYNHVKS
ncbi:unannotated protein [freshwater metagenome]|uniref:Unannotated protein n=1 Tax=freshwater metagenome TaxID=449393 RepID=A0A6J6FJ19_9ZZZZ